MNTPTKLPAATQLFAGEIFDGHDAEHPTMMLLDGTPIAVRVRIVQARHLTEPDLGWLAHYEAGREAQRLELSLQQKTAEGWAPADAAFVDNLHPESHVRLVAEDERLNFSRAISQAERAIATGTAMQPMKQRMLATLMQPLSAAIESMVSSAITRISAAAAAKTP